MLQVNPIQDGAKAETASNLDAFLSQIQNGEDTIRTKAIQNASSVGVTAVAPLIQLMEKSNKEIARSANRALYVILHHAGRPKADDEAKNVENALLQGLEGGSMQVKRDILRMLSEIGKDASINPIARLLADKELSDDACMALQRIPGKKSISALKKSLKNVPESMRYPIAEALRKRGEKVEAYPCQKLIPTKSSTL